MLWQCYWWSFGDILVACWWRIGDAYWWRVGYVLATRWNRFGDVLVMFWRYADDAFGDVLVLGFKKHAQNQFLMFKLVRLCGLNYMHIAIKTIIKVRFVCECPIVGNMHWKTNEHMFGKSISRQLLFVCVLSIEYWVWRPLTNVDTLSKHFLGPFLMIFQNPPTLRSGV